MKEELFTDLWLLVIEHVPEKYRKDMAADFINTLVDHDIATSIFTGLKGIDSNLDDAITCIVESDDADEYNDYDSED